MIDDPDARRLLAELSQLLGSIRTNVDRIARTHGADRALLADVDHVGLATERATQLTSQLLGAAKDTFVPGATPTAVTAPRATVILLVEDERLVRHSIQRLLDQLGYTVISAESPGEALGHCRESEGPIDLLLTDYAMPGMNGVELGTRVRALRPTCKVVVMSGYAPNTTEGAEGMTFLAKPFSIDGLSNTVRDALEC